MLMKTCLKTKLSHSKKKNEGKTCVLGNELDEKMTNLVGTVRTTRPRKDYGHYIDNDACGAVVSFSPWLLINVSTLAGIVTFSNGIQFSRMTWAAKQLNGRTELISGWRLQW